jgi:hypothetical protein
MCFSPEASFVAAGVLAPVGVASLRTIRRREQLIVGALPMLFVLHQLDEGIVWLGLRGQVSAGAAHAAIRVYLLVAQVAVPILVPLGFLLLERDRARRLWMAPLLALGVMVAGRLLWILVTHDVGARATDHVIVYDTDSRFGGVVAAGYVLATCGPALLGSDRVLRAFGLANVIGLALAAIVRTSAVTSVWCFYAALASVMILVHLRRQRDRVAPALSAVDAAAG